MYKVEIYNCKVTKNSISVIINNNTGLIQDNVMNLESEDGLKGYFLLLRNTIDDLILKKIQYVRLMVTNIEYENYLKSGHWTLIATNKDDTSVIETPIDDFLPNIANALDI